MRKILIIIMVAVFVLPTMAQQEWQTSTMKTSGSAYSSQITPVGAMTVTEMATTTDNSGTNGPHRAKKGGFPTVTEGTETEDNFKNPQYGPVGDALIPLMLCAGAYLIIRARRRMVRSKVSEKGMEK